MMLQKTAMHKLIRSIAMAAAAASLSGCLATGVTPQAVAPVAPGRPAALTPGQLLEPLKGGLIGTSLGEGLSNSEKQRGLVAEYQALETSFGQAPVTWADAKTGSSGEVVAGAPYRVGQQDCRSYAHKLIRKTLASTATSAKTATGSACRQGNGAWLLL